MHNPADLLLADGATIILVRGGASQWRQGERFLALAADLRAFGCRFFRLGALHRNQRVSLATKASNSVMSALLVMLGHLRAFLFLDFVDLKGTGAVTKVFYFSTGLGHQALMVFFVLSGYCVGGSVLSGLIKGRSYGVSPAY